MKKYSFKGGEILEDLVSGVRHGIGSAGCGLSFLGMEYINQNFLDGAMPSSLPGDTLILSKEFASWAVSYGCAIGSLVNGAMCVYDFASVPLKLVSGKYFKGV
ncbi:hypothetical protein J4226_03645 [Candidatus Pacearchaeota archaeon]|nr:hypothetical protein [Candidatus Pacearchaeota archaeon]